MTPERRYFNEAVLPAFVEDHAKPGSVVLDVGHPDEGWGYRKLWTDAGADYKTVDRSKELKPDIVADIEEYEFFDKSHRLPEIVVCHGVMEQCHNPFVMADAIHDMLLKGGRALFGMLSIGYPLWQDLDLCRFTPQGAERLFSDWKSCNLDVIYRYGDVPSAIYAVVQK